MDSHRPCPGLARRALLLLVLSPSLAAPALADVISLRAGDAPSVTDTSFSYTPGAGVSGSQTILPLPDRIEATSTVLWPGGSMSAARALAFEGVSLDPAALDGEILAIGYRVSQDRPSASNSHPFRVALVQDGRFYQNAYPELRDNVQGGYTTFEDDVGTPADNWYEVDPVVFGDPASTPDTTGAGAPIAIALMLRHGASSGTSQTFTSAFPFGSGPPQGFEVLFGVRPPSGFVPVGDPGNSCNPLRSCAGSVAVPFEMGRFEVTVGEYAAFLAAVAADDPNGLYNEQMSLAYDPQVVWAPGLERSGSPGSYAYSVIPGREDLPVSYVSFWDATRYANWLHNGQPGGPQTAATTEDGAYTLTPAAIADGSVVRNPGARYFVPSRDEWHKAAYYDAGSASYWADATDPVASPISSGQSLVPNRAARNGLGGPIGVGRHFASPSPYGTFNQAGNVSEWTDYGAGTSRLPEGQHFTSGSGLVEPSPLPAQAEADFIGFRIARRAAVSPVPALGAGGFALLCGLLGAAGRRALAGRRARS